MPIALAHLGHHRLGDRAGALGALGERALQAGLVGAQLAVALAHRREQLDHGLRHRLLERAVALALELALDLPRARRPRATARISIRFEMPGLSGARTTSRPESVSARA